jgi:hypothetical protein
MLGRVGGSCRKWLRTAANRATFLHPGIGFGDFAELVGPCVVGSDVVVGILAGQIEYPQCSQRDGRLFDDAQHAAEFLLHLRPRARHAELADEERLLQALGRPHAPRDNSLSFSTFSNSGQIGLWRFSYSSSAPAWTDMTKALRIFMMF